MWTAGRAFASTPKGAPRRDPFQRIAAIVDANARPRGFFTLLLHDGCFYRVRALP